MFFNEVEEKNFKTLTLIDISMNMGYYVKHC
jgi:hypothetical protein